MSPGYSADKRSTPALDAMSEVSAATIGALEAALLRPALQAVRQDASRYKARTMAAVLNSLPPLDLVIPATAAKEESKRSESFSELENLAKTLTEARSQVRMDKASVTVVDLSKSDKSSRQMFLESTSKTYTAEMKLANAALATERYLNETRGISVNASELGGLLGKVKIAGEGSLAVPLTVNRPLLNRLHSCMLG